MQDERQDEILAKLQDERSRLEERLRLLEEAETPATRGDGPVTETPESVRAQLEQVDRMLADHARQA